MLIITYGNQNGTLYVFEINRKINVRGCKVLVKVHVISVGAKVAFRRVRSIYAPLVTLSK